MSFVDCTLEQIQESIKAEDPEWPFSVCFWQPLLQGQPSAKFKPLRNRTLTFWVACFSKWQETHRAAGATAAEARIGAQRFQQIAFLSRTNLGLVLELFNPEGARLAAKAADRLMGQGAARVSLPLLEVLVAGVLSSGLIATSHKLRYVLSLVDHDDARRIDESKFELLVRIVCRGLGMMSGVAHQLLPSDAVLTQTAKRCFASARRLATQVSSASGRLGTARPLTYEEVMEWCAGTSSCDDPLAVPFLLAIQRFCCARRREVSDEFDDRLESFALSHTAVMRMPTLLRTPANCKVLTRKEVLMARDLLEHAKRREGFDIHASDAEVARMMAQRNWRADADINHHLKRQWLLDGLRKLRDGHVGAVTHADLFDYLRILSPHALPKHLRMYGVWCAEYEEMQRSQEQLLLLQAARDKFIEEQRKPFLPLEQVYAIKRQFRDLDVANRGVISQEDIVAALGLSQESALDILHSFDVSHDGFVDEEYFLRMMCPPEYRLRDAAAFARDVFIKVLVHEVNRKGGDISELQERYLVTPRMCPTDAFASGSLPAPSSALPEASAEDVRQWTEVFDNLDADHDDRLQAKDLECSGLLTPALSQAVVSFIGAAGGEGFTKEAFLEIVARAHGCRQHRPLLVGDSVGEV